MSISRTDRERLTLVIATLNLEAKQARERSGRARGGDILFEAMWAERCGLAVTTLHELIERREKEG